MDDKQQAINEILKAARRSKGLTQSALAAAAGCKQSAVSMFEAGRADALSSKAVSRIAEILGVGIQAMSEAGTAPIRGPADHRVLKYCPMDECPSNVPYVMHGKLLFKPTMVEDSATAISRCRYCGEILEERCPNTACGAELNEGSFCAKCGALYVSAIDRDRGPLESWSDTQRARIKDVRQLSQTERAVRGGM